MSLGLGALMTVVFYLLSNVSFPISSENSLLKEWYHHTRLFRNTNPELPDDVLFINIAYDRQLIDVYDEYGFEQGNIDITDRAKLIEFLSLLNACGDYKYTVLDVRFEDGRSTDMDSALWLAIINTPRLVLPSHNGMSLGDSTIMSKTAVADYKITRDENDFAKYPIIFDDRPSIAWRVFSDLSGNDYKSLLGFYFSNGHLMRKSMMPKFDLIVNSEYDCDGNKKYYNLGCDILSDPEASVALFKDKFIYLGDITENDIHGTYRGDVAGTVIHANMVCNLLNGRHLIGWDTLVLIWLIFSLLVMLMAEDVNPVQYIKSRPWVKSLISSIDKDRLNRYRYIYDLFVKWVLPLIGYSTVMAVMVFLLLWTKGQIYELVIASVMLVIVSKILKYTKLI